MGTYEMVVDEGDGEELIAEGTEAYLERELDMLKAEHEAGGDKEGYPVPPYEIRWVD
jgi:hypothetical protein